MNNSINYDDNFIKASVIVSCVGGLSLLLLRMYQSQSAWPVHHYLRIDKRYAGMTVVVVRNACLLCVKTWQRSACMVRVVTKPESTTTFDAKTIAWI